MDLKEASKLLDKLDRPSLLNLKGKKDIIGVEIGVESGVNARNILDNYDIKILYLVDPYTPYKNYTQEDQDKIKSFARKFVGRRNNVIFIEEPSKIAVKYILNDLDFVYIDGDHSYEAVLQDLELYYPKIKSGGFIAGHDYKMSEKGVIKAVNEFFIGKKIYSGGKWDFWCFKE